MKNTEEMQKGLSTARQTVRRATGESKNNNESSNGGKGKKKSDQM